jgi:hypothetical protein
MVHKYYWVAALLICCNFAVAAKPDVQVTLNEKTVKVLSAATQEFAFGSVLTLRTGEERKSVFPKSPDLPSKSSCEKCKVQAVVLVDGKAFFVTVAKGEDGKRFIIFQNEKGEDLTTPLAAKLAGHPNDEMKIFSFLSTVLPEFNANSKDLALTVVHFNATLADCGDSCWFGSQCPSRCYVCQSLCCGGSNYCP